MVSLSQLLPVLWIILVMLFEAMSAIGILLLKKPKNSKKEPTISFVIAAWKEGDRIIATVNSINDQNYPKGKIGIVVIGGGDEKTENVCGALAEQGKITYIKEKTRKGKWFALNTALKFVKGEYIAFTDADCTLERNWLKKMLQPDADIVIADVYATSEKPFYGKAYGYVWFLVSNISAGLNKFVITGEFMGQGSLVKRQVFKNMKFMNSFVEDWKFNYEAKKHGIRVAHSDASVYEYIPATLGDFRKAMMRTTKGYFSEVGVTKDLFSVFVLALLALTAVSLPFYIYQIASLDKFSVSMLLSLVLSTSLFSLSASIRSGKNHRFIAYSPIIIPVVLFLGVSACEAFLRVIAGRKIEWEIYGKKRE